MIYTVASTSQSRDWGSGGFGSCTAVGSADMRPARLGAHGLTNLAESSERCRALAKRALA